jgi:hypothetical protein
MGMTSILKHIPNLLVPHKLFCNELHQNYEVPILSMIIFKQLIEKWLLIPVSTNSFGQKKIRCLEKLGPGQKLSGSATLLVHVRIFYE